MAVSSETEVKNYYPSNATAGYEIIVKTRNMTLVAGGGDINGL